MHSYTQSLITYIHAHAYACFFSHSLCACVYFAVPYIFFVILFVILVFYFIVPDAGYIGKSIQLRCMLYLYVNATRHDVSTSGINRTPVCLSSPCALLCIVACDYCKRGVPYMPTCVAGWVAGSITRSVTSIHTNLNFST